MRALARRSGTRDVLPAARTLVVGAARESHEVEAHRAAGLAVGPREDALAVRGALSTGPAANAPVERSAAPRAVYETLRGPGRPLDLPTRALMERRFGHDFGSVRVHDGPRAAASAAEIRAGAYTLGDDIVFGASRYAPGTRAGARRIAHELAHVVQQSASPEPRVVQRDDDDNSRDAPNAASWSDPSCPDDFCKPHESEMNANVRRTKYWPPLKSAIGLVVSRRVVPLWDDWASGGDSTVRDLTKDFGPDFTASPTTATTTRFLVDSIRAELVAHPPSLTAGIAVLDVPTLVPTAVAAIDVPKGLHEMNFAGISDIPGNIAGGIGKDQAATPVGKRPSAQDDERIARGKVVVSDLGSELLVSPFVSFTVNDTIDLCPGNCGAQREQTATVPMSRWEATGISGDVPYTVDFSGAWLEMLPFTIAKPTPP